MVLLTKSVFRDLLTDVEVIELVHFSLDLSLLCFEHSHQFRLLLHRIVAVLKIFGNLGGGEKQVLELFLENAFQVLNRNFVPALRTDVLGRV